MRVEDVRLNTHTLPNDPCTLQVRLLVGDDVKAKSSVKKKSLTPVWREVFKVKRRGG